MLAANVARSWFSIIAPHTEPPAVHRDPARNAGQKNVSIIKVAMRNIP
jgi:hypothetical protein